MAASKHLRTEGADNDLIARIAADTAFGLNEEELANLLQPEHYIGRADRQVDEFLAQHVKPLLDRHHDEIGIPADLKV
jgi:adenylosuccinate lyase